MTRRRAANNESVTDARRPRNRSKLPSVEVEHRREPWTDEEPLPTEFPARNFGYRRWAKPRLPTVKVTIYIAGDDDLRGLQHRACLRRAQALASDVSTPIVFEDRTTKFSKLEALVRDVSAETVIIFSTMARRAAGDRIEAMKIALVDRAVKFIEVPEWYRGFEDMRPWQRRNLSWPTDTHVDMPQRVDRRSTRRDREEEDEEAREGPS